MCRMTWLSLVLSIGIALAGCVTTPNSAPEGQPSPPHRVVNNTFLPYVTLAGVDQFGEYTSLALKMTYVFDENGRLYLEKTGQEPAIDEHTPTSEVAACKSYGAVWNQVTTWFPDTGLFAFGARWKGVQTAAGEPRALLALSDTDHGTMAVGGEQARSIEYSYAPCVGGNRVREGYRAVGFVAPGDWLQVHPLEARKPPLRLRIPPDPMPYVALRFTGRPSQRALVPGRIVLLTLDMNRRRLVLQYQATVAIRPQVELATWDMTRPVENLDEKSARRERAIKDYLTACVPPNRPMDPCANPHGSFPEILQD